MEIKAALALEGGAKLTEETVTLDKFGEDDILIENRAAGLCASDAGQLSGAKPGVLFPLLSGHEGSGVVVEVGSNITHLKRGDHVATCAVGECCECPTCKSDLTNMCPVSAKPGLAAAYRLSDHFTFNGEPVAVTAPGATFATHTICDSSYVTKIDEDISFEVAALLGCAVMTGVGSVLNTAKVRPGSTVVVFGLGGVGLNVVDGAQLAGAERIIGIDVNPNKDAVGRQFGMTDFLCAPDHDNIVEAIHEITGGGADYAFECSGVKPLVQQAVDSTQPDWGIVTLVGIPSDPQLDMSLRDILSGRTITGFYFGKMSGRSGMAHLAELYLDGKLHCDKLVSDRYSLEQINSGFDAMNAGDAIRGVVNY